MENTTQYQNIYEIGILFIIYLYLYTIKIKFISTVPLQSQLTNKTFFCFFFGKCYPNTLSVMKMQLKIKGVKTRFVLCF